MLEYGRLSPRHTVQYTRNTAEQDVWIQAAVPFSISDREIKLQCDGLPTRPLSSMQLTSWYLRFVDTPMKLPHMALLSSTGARGLYGSS